MNNFRQVSVNGLHIATSEMPHMNSVSAGFFLPVGSRFESELENGVAHFVEHMIFKGTATHNALQLAIAIEGAGGTINAFTSEDQTCLETRGPADLLPDFIKIMSDMLWNSLIAPEEVDREREVIAEEIIMYQENPSDNLNDLLSKSIWTNHPLGRPITGTEITLKNIDQQHIKSFMDRHYRSKGITLAVAGNINHDHIVNLTNQIVPPLNNESSTPLSYEHPSTNSPFNLEHDQRNLEQLHLALAFHTSGRKSPNRHALNIISLLLGETMSSRFFQELREKRGLCYNISTDYSFYEETGSFEIHIALDPERLDECLNVINQLITEVKSTGFTDTEIAQAKRYADGQAKISLETPNSRMHWMGDSINCFGKIIDPQLARERLLSITPEEIHDVLSNTFQIDQMAAASIGPFSTQEIRLKIDHNLNF